MSQWDPTDPFEVGGMWFHVVRDADANSRTRKRPDHMVLEFWSAAGQYPDGYHPGRWIPVPMAFGMLLADFFFKEEDHLYSRKDGNLGGDKYFRALWWAAHHGWKAADRELQRERRTKQHRMTRPYRTAKNPNVSAESFSLVDPAEFADE